MSLSFISNENNTEVFNLTNTNIIKLPTSTIDDNNENKWNVIKSFFNLQNSLIIICILFFFFTLCLVFIIIQLMKKKYLYKKQIKSQTNNYSHIHFPFQTKNSLSPIHMDLTSNQIASIPIDKNSRSTINNDEIETVHEILAMEERNGKIYYKVNFIGHSPDYTAWVCEEDLIPE